MERDEAVKIVAELMDKANIATLATMSDGRIVSRPMAVQQVEFDGDVWFFTYNNSDKITDIQANPGVNVAFESGNSWVSLSGTAELSHDKDKMAELWNPLYKAWFPEGLDEPGIAMLKIHAESAEYWDSSNSKVVTLFGMIKAAATGKRAEGGENKTVEL